MSDTTFYFPQIIGWTLYHNPPDVGFAKRFLYKSQIAQIMQATEFFTGGNTVAKIVGEFGLDFDKLYEDFVVGGIIAGVLPAGLYNKPDGGTTELTEPHILYAFAPRYLSSYLLVGGDYNRGLITGIDALYIPVSMVGKVATLPIDGSETVTHHETGGGVKYDIYHPDRAKWATLPDEMASCSGVYWINEEERYSSWYNEAFLWATWAQPEDFFTWPEDFPMFNFHEVDDFPYYYYASPDLFSPNINAIGYYQFKLWILETQSVEDFQAERAEVDAVVGWPFDFSTRGLWYMQRDFAGVAFSDPTRPNSYICGYLGKNKSDEDWLEPTGTKWVVSYEWNISSGMLTEAIMSLVTAWLYGVEMPKL